MVRVLRLLGNADRRRVRPRPARDSTRAGNLNRFWRRVTAAIGTVLVLALPVPWGSSVAAEANNRAAESGVSPDGSLAGRLIVKYRPGVDRTRPRILAEGVTLSPVLDLDLIGATLVTVPAGAQADALALLARDPDVEYAEPDQWVQMDRYPNDPSFPLCWGLENLGQTGGLTDADIDATEAWNVATGDSIVIGIIDSGVDTAHVDLRGNIWTNPGEIPGNHVDDDGNGFVDDVHGWDFLNWDNDPFDDNGHGTHVAGTVAARGNNGIGVAGVLWSARIMPLKFLRADGFGSTSHAVLALAYAVRMGARLTCNSWGGTGYSQALRDAIDSAGAAGLIFVAAAGNVRANLDIQPHYPAAYDLDCIISVCASDHLDRLASEPTWGSNWGPTRVDLAAPGVNVYSTVPGAGYDFKSGTSMAAPHVAGAAALLWSEYPWMTSAQVKTRLLRTVDKKAELRGKNVSEGRLNLYRAIQGYDAVAPAAIIDLRAVKAEGTRVTLAWTAPGDDGATGTAARYDLRYAPFPIDSSSFELAVPVALPFAPGPAGTIETAAVRNLSFDTDYFFAIRAEDDWFNASSLSGTVAVRTLAPPRLVVAPDLFVDTLRAGETAAHPLYLANLGVGELVWTTSAEFSFYSPVGDSAGGGSDDDPPELAADPGHRGAKTAGASGMRVLLIYADDGALGLQQILAAYPDVENVEVWPAGVNGGTIPSYADVDGFDAVVAWNNRIWADVFAIGELLATCVDSGIAVISAVDCWGTNQFASRGRYFDSSGYSPFRAVGPARFAVRTLGVHNAAHPVMRDVSNLAIGSYYNAVALTPGARDVAFWDDGTPLVATNSGTVAINVWPGDGYHWIGDFPNLLHNAIRFALGNDFWLSVTAGPGEIVATNSRQLSVQLDARRLLGGRHEGSVVISTNDPVAPEMIIPVQLEVLGTARMKLDSTSIDCGAVFVGYEQSRQLHFANQGTGVLDVSAALDGAPEFSVWPSRILLTPGRDTVFTVTFRPQAQGPASVELALTSNDSAAAHTVISVHGLGAPVPAAGLTPTALNAELFTGAESRQTMTLTNSGAGPLDFEIRVKGRRPPSLSPAAAGAQADEPASGDLVGISDTVDVLLWNLYGDTSPGGEVGKTKAALLGAYPAARITETDESDPLALEKLLSNRQVMIIPEQENALPDLLTRAASWRRVLSDFVFTGGTVIFCQEWGNSTGLARATGLLDVEPVDRGSSVRLEVASPGHPLLEGISDSLVGSNLTAWYTIHSPDARGVVVEPLTGKAVVVDRPWGVGHVVLLGFDYFSYNDDMARILANAVLSSHSGLSWVDALPRVGTVPPDASTDVDVVLRASGLAGGDYEADLVVSTSDPERPRLFVPAFLNVTDAPHLVVDVKAIEYGDVYLGQSATDTLRIVNHGTLPLDVFSLLADDSAFSVSPGGFTLAAGESRGVAIVFTPEAPGPVTASVVVASNDPDESAIVLELAGKGVVPPTLSVSPASLNAGMLTGGRDRGEFTVSNSGGSDLWFTVHARIADEPEGAEPSLAWRARAGLPAPQAEHGLVAHPNGKLYAVGGFVDGVGMLASLRIYDPATNVWTAGPSRPAADRGMATALGADGKVYTFSSVSGLSACYDPEYDTWKPIPPPPINLVREATAAGASGRIYLFGGEGESANDPLGAVQAFDPVSMSWSIGTPMPTARYQHEAVTGPDGRIYVMGGRTSFSAAPLDVMEIYDPETNSWDVGPPLPLARGHFAAALGADGRIYVLGGKPSYLHNEAPFFTTCDAYDPRTRTWSARPPLPVGLGECAAARVGREVYLVGGSDGIEQRSVFALHTPRWVETSPDSGTIAAGGALSIDVEFDATGLATDLFLGALAFSSNDPDQPRLERSVELNVISAPDLALFQDSIDFGEVFIGHEAEKRIRLSNTGFEPLTAIGIAAGPGDFTVSPSSVTIAPGEVVHLSVRFAPLTEGVRQATLTIPSNDPDRDTARVVLLASGAGAPQLTLEPTSFDLSLKSGEAVDLPVQIGNVGFAALKWRLPELTVASSAPSRIAVAAAAAVQDELAHLEGRRIGFMEIPGTDPYTSVKSELRARGADVVSVPFPFIASMLAELDVLAIDYWFSRATEADVDSVRAWLARGGGLLWQASTAIYDPIFARLTNGTGITAYRSDDSSLTLTAIRAHATTLGVDSVEAPGERAFCTVQEPGITTVFDDRGRTHAAVTAVGSGRLCVVGNRLCTNPNLARAGTRLFANRIFDWLASGTVVQADRLEGLVLPGDVETVTVRFDAGSLVGGEYDPRVMITSNDPARPEILLPVHLEVTGVPAIAAASDSLQFDTSYVGYGTARVLQVFNHGTEPLSVTISSSDDLVFTPAPSAFVVPVFGQTDVQVTFRPADTGWASAQLALTSDDPLSPQVYVALVGRAILPPKIRTSTDSLDIAVRAGEIVHALVTVDNQGASPLEVEFDAENAITDLAAVRTAGGSDLRKPLSLPDLATSWIDPAGAAPSTAWRKPGAESVPDASPAASAVVAQLAQYRGEYLTFGISNIGELWPFRYPGDTAQVFSSGYLVAYRIAGADHVKSVWFGGGPINPTGFREIVNDSLLVVAEFTAVTDDGQLEIIRRFSFERRHKYVTVETELVNLTLSNMDDVVFKSFADFDVDITHLDDDWDYDTAHHMVYARDRRVLGLAGKRAADFMDIEGRGDAWQRKTAVDFAAGPVINYDGLALLHFERGKLTPGQSTQIMVTMAVGDDKDELDFEVERGLQRVKWLTLDSASATVPPQSAFGLGLHCDATLLYGGDYSAHLMFRSNDPAQPEVRVPVHLHVTGVPVLSLQSDTLDFGVVYLGYPITRFLTVTNRGTDHLQVSSVESDLGVVAVDISGFALSPGTDTTLQITFTPEAVGPVEGTLTFRSTDSAAAVRHVMLQAVVALPPVFVRAPDSIALVLPEGDSEKVQITIANAGAGTLFWSVADLLVAPTSGKSADESDSDAVGPLRGQRQAGAAGSAPASPLFSMSPASGTLAPGLTQDATLVVRTTGLAAGWHHADLTFTHNDPANPPAAVGVYLDVFAVQRGDANADRQVDARDIIYLVKTLWSEGPDPYGTSGDLNCDNAVTLADIITLINYVFKGGPAPDC